MHARSSPERPLPNQLKPTMQYPSHIAVAPVGHYPTPLEELSALSKIIDGPRIWVKRDDLTGVAMGGSKTRALATLLGDALSKGADTVITCGPVTSNHTRITAAAANRLGLNAILVLRHPGDCPPGQQARQGNMLLNRLLGARIEYVAANSLADLEPAMQHIAAELASRGKRPYVIPGGGYSPVGSLGYLGLAEELAQQSARQGFMIDAVICASGSGCIQSGLILGKAFHDADYPVIGITINRGVDELAARIAGDVTRASRLVGIELPLRPADIHILDGYNEHGYAVPSQAGMAAIELLAKTEGLLLDPCYTGKAMAGALDLARTKFAAGQNIVFIHTGGSPAIFGYSNLLSRAEPQ